MPDEGGGGFAGSRILGIPTIVWIGGVALIVYFLFFRNSQTATPTTGGGGGTITTGATTVRKGAVTVNVTTKGQGQNEEEDKDKKKKKPKTSTDHKNSAQPVPPVTSRKVTSSHTAGQPAANKKVLGRPKKRQ